MTWGFVDTVSHDIKDIHKALDPVLSTPQKRKANAISRECRPLRRGYVCNLMITPAARTLQYVLELPQHPGEVRPHCVS